MILKPDWQQYAASPLETMGIGEKLAEQLDAGDVLALCGGLGAGKTHFTKGLAKGLGCDAEVTSPTFSLAHEYRGGRFDLFHFDFYRMEDEQEVLRIGWDEYLDEEGVIVVEWPTKFPHLLPEHTQWLEITPDAEGRIIRSVSPN